MSYQNVDGIVADNPRRAMSKFWNEGKWKTFIEPLLPLDCTNRVFVEMGCNIGLFLKMAIDKGFRKVCGIEKKSNTIILGEQFKSSIGYNYTLLSKKVGVNYKPLHVPVADVTLLSNVHYHIEIEHFLEYMDILPYRTLYCIVVSCNSLNKKYTLSKADRNKTSVLRYFKNWEEVKSIGNKEICDDLVGREGMYSILFKSKKLSEVDVNVWLNKTNVQSREYGKLRNIFIDDMLNKRDVKDTEFYRYFLKHYEKSKNAFNRVNNLKKLVYSIQKTGFKRPIIISSERLIDGNNRLAIAKKLGYTTILGRTI